MILLKKDFIIEYTVQEGKIEKIRKFLIVYITEFENRLQYFWYSKTIAILLNFKTCVALKTDLKYI